MRRYLHVLLIGMLCAASAHAAGDVSDNVVGDMVAPTNGGTFSSAILAPAGTAALPGLAVGTTNKGIYDAGSNTLGFASSGASTATLDSSGNLATAGYYTLPAAGSLKFGTRSQIQSTADSYLVLLDTAGTAFTGLRFGGTSASFPMWKRATTTLSARLADDSADAGLLAAAGTFSGVVTTPAGNAAGAALALNAAGDGLFQVSAGIVGLTGAGVEVGRLSSTLLQIPAASLITWNGRGTLNSTSDGILALNKNAGGSNGTSMVFGNQVSIGNTVVASRLRIMNANQSANASMEALSYITTTAGNGLTDASGNGFTINSATQNQSTSALLMKVPTASKTTSYPVVAGDSGTYFDNTGAGGTVVTFTLPAAAVGLMYGFSDVLTTALSGIVIATNSGSDTIAYAAKTAGQSITSPVAARNSVILVCTAANTWSVMTMIGTYT